MTLSHWIVAATLAAAALPAAALDLLPADQGSVSRNSSLLGTDITHDPTSQTVQVRNFFFGGGVGTVTQRQLGYALFEVPAGLAQPVSAQLKFTVDLAAIALAGTVSVFDVSSAPADFQVAYTGGTGGAALFNDLGGGTAYGTVTLAAQTLNQLSLSLDAQALADLAAARGGVFGVGFVGGLGASPLALPATLNGITLEVSAVPELGSAALALAGLAGLGGVLARRRRG